MSPNGFRDILRCRAISVAFGFEADIYPLAEFDASVENDPIRTSSWVRPAADDPKSYVAMRP
jgi:hypothetical protein